MLSFARLFSLAFMVLLGCLQWKYCKLMLIGFAGLMLASELTD
jgi:hypothetical protein